MEKNIPLSKLPPGGKCLVRRLDAKGHIRRRMLDLGIVDNTVIEALSQSPSGGLTAYLIRGAVIALRHETAETVMVKAI